MVQRVDPDWTGDKHLELTCQRPLRHDGTQPSADPTAAHAPTLPERPVC